MRGPLHGFRQSRVGYATSAGCIPLPRSHGWHDLHPQRVAGGAAAAARTTRSVKDAFCRCDVPLQRRCAADDAVNEPAFVRSCRGVSLRVSACAVAQVGRWAGENYRPMVPSIASKMHGHKLVSMLPRWLVPPTRETCVGGPSQNEDIPLYLGVAV